MLQFVNYCFKVLGNAILLGEIVSNFLYKFKLSVFTI